MKKHERKINALITRNGMVVRACVYADTAAHFVFERPGVDLIIKYLDNGEYKTVGAVEFVGEFVGGKFQVNQEK